MRNKIYALVLFACLIQIYSCKKDSKPVVNAPQNQSLEQGLINFSVNGQLVAANIDTTHNIITVVVPRTASMQSLTVNFTLAGQVSATINNSAASSGTTIDFTKPVVLKVMSSDQKRSASFQVVAETDLQYMGITGNIIAEKSLNKDYAFYFDQFDGSQYQGINCGPTSTTMAIKWADSTFTGLPADARNAIPEGGGWWYTGDVQQYLRLHGINSATDTLDDVATVVKNAIDNNDVVILCLDMYNVPQVSFDYMHIQKFYFTASQGWGHFMLIKGYKKTDTNFYLEAYDPYSDHETYASLTPDQLMGQDRYYIDYSIKLATEGWWPYAIIVAPKGKTITSSRLTINSIHAPVPQGKGQ